MAKQPSVETQLRRARADCRELNAELIVVRKRAAEYCTRATKAEQELAEWKQRFDILLRRDGGTAGGASHD